MNPNLLRSMIGVFLVLASTSLPARVPDFEAYKALSADERMEALLILDETTKDRYVRAMTELANSSIDPVFSQLICESATLSDYSDFTGVVDETKILDAEYLKSLPAHVSDEFKTLSYSEVAFYITCDKYHNPFFLNMHPREIRYNAHGLSGSTLEMIRSMGPLLLEKGPDGRTPLEYIQEKLEIAMEHGDSTVQGIYSSLRSQIRIAIRHVVDSVIDKGIDSQVTRPDLKLLVDSEIESRRISREKEEYYLANKEAIDAERAREKAEEQARWEARARQPAPALASNANDGVQVGKRFKDCDACPEMVIVPAGQFMMGSERNFDDETMTPQYEDPIGQVTIPRPFAVGVFEVTRKEVLACVDDGHCLTDGWECWYDRSCTQVSPEAPDTWADRLERLNAPADELSWHDAQDYVAWLSKKTGERYRLLTEAEWEYVARAGSQTRYWWGDEFEDDKTSCCKNEPSFLVGSFEANGFGLFDVHGNVSEWTEDCFMGHWGYADAPSDGSAANGPQECKWRISRGGISSFRFPDDARSARRKWNLTSDENGLRVARDL